MWSTAPMSETLREALKRPLTLPHTQERTDPPWTRDQQPSGPPSGTPPGAGGGLIPCVSVELAGWRSLDWDRIPALDLDCKPALDWDCKPALEWDCKPALDWEHRPALVLRPRPAPPTSCGRDHVLVLSQSGPGWGPQYLHQEGPEGSPTPLCCTTRAPKVLQPPAAAEGPWRFSSPLQQQKGPVGSPAPCSTRRALEVLQPGAHQSVWLTWQLVSEGPTRGH
ncbi:unnamed protein product [Gadus morhua 'NCC']